MNPKTVPAGSGAVFTFMPAPDNVLPPLPCRLFKKHKKYTKATEKKKKIRIPQQTNTQHLTKHQQGTRIACL